MQIYGLGDDFVMLGDTSGDNTIICGLYEGGGFDTSLVDWLQSEGQLNNSDIDKNYRRLINATLNDSEALRLGMAMMSAAELDGQYIFGNKQAERLFAQRLRVLAAQFLAAQ